MSTHKPIPNIVETASTPALLAKNAWAAAVSQSALRVHQSVVESVSTHKPTTNIAEPVMLPVMFTNAVTTAHVQPHVQAIRRNVRTSTIQHARSVLIPRPTHDIVEDVKKIALLMGKSTAKIVSAKAAESSEGLHSPLSSLPPPNKRLSFSPNLHTIDLPFLPQ